MAERRLSFHCAVNMLIMTLTLLTGCAGHRVIPANDPAIVRSEQVSRYPVTDRIPVTEVIHDIPVTDDFRWLENGEDPAVENWTQNQVSYTRSFLDGLPQRSWLASRFRDQFFYDDSTPPTDVYSGPRTFWWEKRKEQEHWIYFTRAEEGADAFVLLDPNSWERHVTLDVIEPSRDGRYLVFGKAKGGDENPVLQVMEVETRMILADTCRGWRQGGISWLPDNSGFFYTAFPLKGEVGPGEEHFWHAAWFHKLGTTAEHDRRVYWHDSIKEAYHQVVVSQDGNWLFYYRVHQGNSEISIGRTGENSDPVPVVVDSDGYTVVYQILDKLFFWTDVDAPMGTVWITDIGSPGRDHWKPFLPETDDRLEGIALTAGRIYATYLHDVHTVVKIYDLQGNYLRDLPLPELCNAVVHGYWHRDRAKVAVLSFNRPTTTYEYDFENDSMSVYHAPPVHVDSDSYEVDQVFYMSRDGTRIPMFIIGKHPIDYHGDMPVILNGYGGFGAAMTPSFSAAYINWMDAGGIVAIACIRGGGEYGKDWHEAGKKEKKQTVFDDFIAAAEWLIDSGLTRPDRLVIKGDSNGGLLVGAVATQRPELFKAVYCGVPLLDMIRYHLFGVANLWESEYGSSADPTAFNYLMDYSPYHKVRNGIRYPNMLIQAGINDARVDPMHARKMVARLQTANPDPPGKALLLIWEDSGHGGGTDLTTLISQQVDIWAFLMDQAGLVPDEPADASAGCPDPR